jgi:hypothetical protein
MGFGGYWHRWDDSDKNVNAGVGTITVNRNAMYVQILRADNFSNDLQHESCLMLKNVEGIRKSECLDLEEFRDCSQLGIDALCGVVVDGETRWGWCSSFPPISFGSPERLRCIPYH